MRTKAKIVIIGAGAAEIAASDQLAQRFDGAEIILLERRRERLRQPGCTPVAVGLKPPSYRVSTTAEWLSEPMHWIEERAAEIDPVAKVVITNTGQRLAYDFLVVAPGLELNYGAIEGMDVRRIGINGLGSVYAGPDGTEATWRVMSAFADKGGVGVFLRPSSEIKCVGAPLKSISITDDVLRRRGSRHKAELEWFAPMRTLFGDRGVRVNSQYVLTWIDLGNRIATFLMPDGPRDMG